MLQTYGMTETASQVATEAPGEAGRKPGSAGRPLEGFEVRAVDGAGRSLPPGAEGRLEVRGPAVSPGYLGEPERLPGAWYRTGDSGWLDGDGCVFVAGRADAVIVTGGENVHPEEVEAVLRECPGVADARVYGEADAEWGRRVVAEVAPSGLEGLDPARLEAFARARLASHQVPKHWVVVPAVARASELGKPLPPGSGSGALPDRFPRPPGVPWGQEVSRVRAGSADHRRGRRSRGLRVAAAAGAGRRRRGVAPGGGRGPFRSKGEARQGSLPHHGPGVRHAGRRPVTCWVGAGLISAEQADAIAGFERAGATGRGPAGGERRVSLLAEALGYVGVILALAGAAVGLAQGWEDLAVWARLAIPAAATALLLLGGALLRRQEEPAFRRLMSVLWVLSVGGLAWTLAVLGSDVVDFDPEPIALMAAAGCTVLAAGLWLLRRHGLQQTVLLASLHALVVSGLIYFFGEDLPVWWFAVAVWGLGVAWAALGWRDAIAPGWLAVAFGCLGAVVGPAFGLGEYEWLLAPALVTAGSLMAVSVPTRQTPLLALGTLGAFGYITWAVVHYFEDSLGVPVALVIVGAVFLVLAVLAGSLATRGKGKVVAVPE